MKRRGFLNQVVGGDLLESAVHACLDRMRTLAPRAARLNKQVFRALALVNIEHTAIDLVASAYRYADSDEHREGVTAFIEKRPPRFAS